MKLQKYWVILPLITATFTALAEEKTDQKYQSTFHFSTEVRRIVDKDLMFASVYSRKTGESLAKLRTFVSKNLNEVLELAKQYPTIEVEATGIQNYPHYKKEKVKGWEAQGDIRFKSKDFEAMEKLLNGLGDEIALNSIDFSVSPEKMAVLEDEMTAEMIQKLQHKADIIKKGLNAKSYILSNIQLDSVNNRPRQLYRGQMAQMTYASKSSFQDEDSLPLEAGKETIVTRASGTVKFEQ
ncbi:SIMPL domain-containing protein [Pasteurella skyensis]|uniref:SIMPL domain-containing protein n=1 Tax=Phocoenobacter skyensis TaxID=97481 RepID=A0AAJ6N843_9PAST|nr:SIMPL domain-containing protein [Pasteurella skyensis]MDP8161805.1 SIMPL domain-containing protein [Pasteurella skyensis]MDP8171961.1 SIMPL domain-containing protein [Pasteurella skyensis]MDP8176196.1 SIMPL domain-containing protein [Pasteurella skyensis]MDP8178216.1 SIMPL domain-containing protein [Pasteurella skyensis]MDP8182176.1 SIMPL domain-containing protein [Pasteurella skyensis]